MNLMNRSSALLLCMNFGPVAAAEAAEHGWYLIGSGGESSASGLSQGQVDNNLGAIFSSVGLDVLDSNSTLDDSDTGFGLAGGYQHNDHLAFEFAYVDLGTIGYRATSTVSDGVDQFAAEAVLENSVDGAVFSALGILPIGEQFAVYGRAGVSLMTANGTARITVDGESQRDSQSSQMSDLMFGVGAEYSLTRHFAIRLAWDRYLDVGTQHVIGDADADFFSLGVRMGVGFIR
jgi:opacity protein-like surface antigen